MNTWLILTTIEDNWWLILLCDKNGEICDHTNSCIKRGVLNSLNCHYY